MVSSQKNRIQYLVAFSVSIASLTVAVIATWLSPVIPKLTNNETSLRITQVEISWVVALSAPGFIIGSLLTRFVCDTFGRRSTILSSAVPLLVGSLIAVCSSSVGWLFVTRFLWGVGTGMVGTVVPMYLAEISNKEIRGSVTISTRVMFNLGALLTMSVGPYLSYNTLNSVVVVLPMLFVCSCWWIPESPYYYLKEGMVDDARRSIIVLKGITNLEEIDEIVKTIERSVRNEMENSSTAKELFTGKRYRKALLLCIVLKMIQVSTGSATISQYLGVIMMESHTPLSTGNVLLIFGVINFIVGFVTTVLVDHCRRRSLMYYSFFGTALCLGTVGAYFFLLEVTSVNRTILSSFGCVTLLGIILSKIISTLGYSSLMFVLPAEVFPINVKAIALTSISVFAGIASFVVALGYQQVKNIAGLTGVFWSFSVIAVIGGVFSIFYVPETKGKSLEEVQKYFETKIEKYDDVEMNENSVKVSLKHTDSSDQEI